VLIITVDTAPAIVTLRFNGRLALPEIGEVARMWNVMAFKPPRRRVLLDLSAVTAIDAAGKQFLERVHQEGNTLVSGVTTSVIVAEIVATCEVDEHDLQMEQAT